MSISRIHIRIVSTKISWGIHPPPLLLPPTTITFETGRHGQPHGKKTKSNFKMMHHQTAEHSPGLF
jgi:hypothetical protein